MHERVPATLVSTDGIGDFVLLSRFVLLSVMLLIISSSNQTLRRRHDSTDQFPETLSAIQVMDVDSSDIEFSPKASKRRNLGQQSIEDIIKDATKDRKESKKTNKQLEFGYGAPGTRDKQDLWIQRFDAYREHTLGEDLATPFDGEDVVRSRSPLNRMSKSETPVDCAVVM